MTIKTVSLMCLRGNTAITLVFEKFVPKLAAQYNFPLYDIRFYVSNSGDSGQEHEAFC